MEVDALLFLGVSWTFYGVVRQVFIPRKYRKKEWMKSYSRFCGRPYLLVGIGWLGMYLLTHGKFFSVYEMLFDLIFPGVLAMAYVFIGGRKYDALFKAEETLDE